MTTKFIFVTTILLSFLGLTAQEEATNVYYDTTFNWSIIIPDGFFSVTPEEWAVMQNRGKEAFEESLDGEIIEPATTILVVKKNQFNYIEANYMVNDPEDGTPEETVHLVGDLMYLTLQDQMPGLPIDSSYSNVLISGLDFTLFTININFEEQQLMLRIEMYSHVFEDKDFTLNIMYMDEEQGLLMKDAWFASKFE